jgi:hypothetical protein
MVQYKNWLRYWITTVYPWVSGTAGVQNDGEEFQHTEENDQEDLWNSEHYNNFCTYGV